MTRMRSKVPGCVLLVVDDLKSPRRGALWEAVMMDNKTRKTTRSETFMMCCDIFFMMRFLAEFGNRVFSEVSVKDGPPHDGPVLNLDFFRPSLTLAGIGLNLSTVINLNEVSNGDS